jgi:hypothetical protein
VERLEKTADFETPIQTGHHVTLAGNLANTYVQSDLND